jgi:hypothetical protein
VQGYTHTRARARTHTHALSEIVPCVWTSHHRLRVPVEVTVLGWDADFGEWAQLEEGSLAEIARQPGFKVKLTAKK